MTPKRELKLLIDRLKVARKGIILLHDPKAQTASMLPAFLHYLRDNDYHIVHVVPGAPGVDFDGAP
jgi:peptidoglycan/xylan/chitin deacetylase (PgdA/CDA1 family)